jgi:hypothetical protein
MRARRATRTRPIRLAAVSILVGAAAVAVGVLITAHTSMALILPTLSVLIAAILAVRIVQKSLGGTAWSIFVFSLLAVGILQDFLYGQQGNPYSYVLRSAELAMIVIACVAAVSRSSRRPPMFMWAAPLLLATSATVSYVLLGYPGSVLIEGLQTYLRFTLLALAISVAQIKERDRTLCETWAAWLVVAISALAIIQFATGSFAEFFRGSYPPSIRGGVTRATGVFPWPNELALFMGAWFFVFYVQRDKSRLYRLAALSAFAAIAVTVTRWTLAAVVGLAILHEVSIRKTRSVLLVLAGAALALWALSGAILPGLSDDLSDNLAGTAPRGMFFVKGLSVWSDAPVFGVGYGRYGSSWAEDIEGTSLLHSYGVSTTESLATTDSFAAAVLPEFGVAGLLVLVIYFTKIASGARKLWHRPEVRAYGMVVAYGLLSTVNSAHVLYAPHTMVIWIAIGFLARWKSQARSVVHSPQQSRRFSLRPTRPLNLLKRSGGRGSVWTGRRSV